MIELALAEISSDPAAWPAAIQRLSPQDAWLVIDAVHAAWIDGTLTPRLLRSGETELELDRAIGRAFAALPESLVDPLERERWADDETDARRWCWAPGWSLMSQDEDLLLMRDDWTVALLEEIGAGCTKRRYAEGIVEHHVRDSVHAALWTDEGSFRARLAWAGSIAEVARATGATRVAEYAARLASYAAHGRVKREDIEQRVLDLRRCHPNPALAPDVRIEGDLWIAREGSGELVVQRDDGRTWARTP